MFMLAMHAGTFVKVVDRIEGSSSDWASDDSPC
jgi:hypothetical protein